MIFSPKGNGTGGRNAALYIKEVLGLERWKDIEGMEGRYQISDQGGIHPYEIAEKMGISRKMVSKIKSGRSYAWLN